MRKQIKLISNDLKSISKNSKDCNSEYQKFEIIWCHRKKKKIKMELMSNDTNIKFSHKPIEM